MILAAVAGSHGAAQWLAHRGTQRQSVVEGLHILGTMLFGAGIWLVAQIYHMDEHYPNAILVWSLGALALGWSIPSLAQGFLAVVLLSLWAGFEAIEFNWVNHWVLPMVAVGVLPLAWQQRSPVLLFFALLAVIVALVLATFPIDYEVPVAPAFFIGAFYVLAGMSAAGCDFPRSEPVLKSLGFAVVFVALFTLSFPGAIEILDDYTLTGVAALLYFSVPLALAVLAWLWIANSRLRGIDDIWRWHWGLLVLSLILVVGVSLKVLPLPGWWSAVPFNLIFLAHCTAFIVHGSRTANGKLVGIACTLFAALVISRYVDLFDSLLLRSLVFLLLGGGLFLVGNFYQRAHRQRDAATP